MKTSRCNPWDNRELDILEGIRFFSFVFLMIMGTSLFMNPAVKATPWNALDMKKGTMFTLIMSTNQATDVFIALSGFIGMYKCMQIYEANGNRLGAKDILKLYARKFFRTAPLIYAVFFFAWAAGSRFSEGPNYTSYQSLFLNCDKYWWSQLLMIGNLVPYFEETNGGCMYWAWTFYVDLQIYLLIPFWAIIYMKSPKIGIAVIAFFIAIAQSYAAAMSIQYNLKMSPIGVEAYYLFGYYINKPWARMYASCIGAYFAMGYRNILSYRR
jgi:peptidoglycan/LPS O-acetylase OafA/YrhL